MKLSDVAIKAAKTKEKNYKLSDGKGLTLLVHKNGSKYWQLRYRFNRKEKTFSIGTYPDVALKKARSIAFKARELLDVGIDPQLDKKRRKFQDDEKTLVQVAKEWWIFQKGTWTTNHADRVWRRLKDDALNTIGTIPITELLPQDIIATIRAIEAREALDVASRVLQDINRVCSFAVRNGYIVMNPAAELSGIVKKRRVKHVPSLSREDLPAFIKKLDLYDGRNLTKYAIQLQMNTFVRTMELRGARWEEFDYDEKLWRIPASRMKMKTEHIVPLTKQTLELLKLIEPISSQYDLVFPGEQHRLKPMSENTVNSAIHRMGYKGRATGHGFRATASSILNEQGFNPDAIERQLAHQERNAVRAAYTHHAQYLSERVEMMQWYSNYLDTLKNKKFS